MTNHDTPMARLESAMETLRRTKARHAEATANMAMAQKQLEIRAAEEAAAAKAEADAEVAVHRAAKSLAGD